MKMAYGNGKIIAAIMLSLLVVALSCSAEEQNSESKSIEQENRETEDIASGNENLGDLEQHRENLLKYYRQGFLAEFSIIIESACEYYGKLRLLTDNDEETKSVFYRVIFANTEDPYLKYHLYEIFENRNCLSSPAPVDQQTKRGEKMMQKARFHSWGGKRSNNNAPKVVIRAPFSPWAGRKRSVL